MQYVDETLNFIFKKYNHGVHELHHILWAMLFVRYCTKIYFSKKLFVVKIVWIDFLLLKNGFKDLLS